MENTTIDKENNKKSAIIKRKVKAERNRPNAIPAQLEWPNMVIDKRGI